MKAKNCVNRNNKMSLILGLAYFHTIFHQEFDNLVFSKVIQPEKGSNLDPMFYPELWSIRPKREQVGKKSA